MPVHIRSDRPRNGPDGLSWKRPGAVVIVKDDALAAELLCQEGMEAVNEDEVPTEAHEASLVADAPRPSDLPNPADNLRPADRPADPAPLSEATGGDVIHGEPPHDSTLRGGGHAIPGAPPAAPPGGTPNALDDERDNSKLSAGSKGKGGK